MSAIPDVRELTLSAVNVVLLFTSFFLGLSSGGLLVTLPLIEVLTSSVPRGGFPISGFLIEICTLPFQSFELFGVFFKLFSLLVFGHLQSQRGLAFLDLGFHRFTLGLQFVSPGLTSLLYVVIDLLICLGVLGDHFRESELSFFYSQVRIDPLACGDRRAFRIDHVTTLLGVFEFSPRDTFLLLTFEFRVIQIDVKIIECIAVLLARLAVEPFALYRHHLTLGLY